YESFYGLRERPFRLTPDPRYLFLSNKHKEAFAHLLYGIKYRNGFVQVTGEIGTGKTLVCRTLLRQVDPDTNVAFIFNPCLSSEELLKNINEEFGIRSTATTRKGLIDELNGFLLEQRRLGKSCVLVIDEAQNLDVDVLEQLRLLSNLETETEKLLQIMLIGQPELDDMLALPELRQLAQRITARYHLLPLDRSETVQYIAHRLRKARGRDKVRFSRGALNLIYKFSGGTPRLINALCDRALLVGYTLEKRQISTSIVKRAISEINGEQRAKQPVLARIPFLKLAWYGTVTAAIAVSCWAVYLHYIEKPGVQPTIEARDLPQPVSPIDVKPNIFDQSGVVLTPENQPATPVEPEKPEVQHVEPAQTAEPVRSENDSDLAFHKFVQKFDYKRSRLVAVKAMLDLWGCESDPDPAVVLKPGGFYETASQYGLMCRDTWANMTKLRVLDMPCVLQVFLPGDDSRPFYMAVTGLDGNTATVVEDYAGNTTRLDVDVIERYWYGRAFVFWKDFEQIDNLLVLGSTGPSVAWLQNELVRQGYMAGPVTAIYDNATANAVALFQRRYRLLADAKVGPETRMALYRVSGQYPVPRLSAGVASHPEEE
ncbi:MAG: AAA family ATPase, partial [Candidatus Hydrogenedentes bacterium]|nr:AAA family ATPase [Candidatus Hydrogenedentota bacterium]